MKRLSVAALLLATACGSAPAREPVAPAPVEVAPAPPAVPAEVAPPKPPGDPPLPVAAPPADAIVLPSGTAYKILVEGSGAAPGRNDTVALRGASWYPDGTLLFEARTAEDTKSGPVWALPSAIAEVVATMKPGARAMFWGPSPLPGAEPARVFDLELVSITPVAPPPADVATPPKAARAIGNGIRVERVARGKGATRPAPGDTVVVRFAGWDASGRNFHTDGAAPRTLASLGRDHRGVGDVVARMAPGEKVRAWIPADRVAKLDPPIDGNALYEIELTSIVPPPEGTPAIPADVAAPPKKARKTASGVSYRVLQKGKGKDRPTETSTVTVHYSGWTTDGAMFDSSVVRGQPATFPLAAVIPGWREAVPTMVVGEKTRFWIPAELAYGADPRPGAPAGMLVFDIELLGITTP
jgi:FKBP-type peptidyl-prolyl cis-trans isomerase